MDAQARKLERSGRPCVDLVHTGGEGGYPDRLAGPAELEHWLGRRLGARIGGARPADVRAARALRRALWGLLYERAAANVAALDPAAAAKARDAAARVGAPVADGAPDTAATGTGAPAVVVAGGAPAARDRADRIATVNAAAARSALVPALAPDGRAAPPAGTAAAGVATLARDAVDLLGGPLGARVRICAAPDCTLLFVDASRPGRRRWCSMERCGTLAKVRRHRDR